MTELEAARAYFENDRFAVENGITITRVGDGQAQCQMHITDRHKNALGNVMGGAIYTLADFTFAVASNFRKKPTVTTTSQITYLRSAGGSVLTATSEMLRHGKTSVYYETSVTDENGRLVARVTSSGQIIDSISFCG